MASGITVRICNPAASHKFGKGHLRQILPGISERRWPSTRRLFLKDITGIFFLFRVSGKFFKSREVLAACRLCLANHGRKLMTAPLRKASFSMDSTHGSIERIANPSMKYPLRAPENKPFSGQIKKLFHRESTPDETAGKRRNPPA